MLVLPYMYVYLYNGQMLEAYTQCSVNRDSEWINSNHVIGPLHDDEQRWLYLCYSNYPRYKKRKFGEVSFSQTIIEMNRYCQAEYSMFTLTRGFQFSITNPRDPRLFPSPWTPHKLYDDSGHNRCSQHFEIPGNTTIFLLLSYSPCYISHKMEICLDIISYW